MEDFDSGWDEPPSSLDSEIMNNFDISEAMNAFEQSELHQQVLDMSDDPTIYAQNITSLSTPGNKEATNSVDCTSLSSEIFLATRLLHDETLDSTTLNTLAHTDSSSYNDSQNVNYLAGSSLVNEIPPDAVDSIGLPHREALDSAFLYSSFERLNSEKQDYDEECSNKSWTESFPPSEIMPAPVQAIPRKKMVEKKPRERKRRIVKDIKKKSISMENTIEEVIKNSMGDCSNSDSTDSSMLKSEISSNSSEIGLKNPLLSSALQSNTEVSLNALKSNTEVRLNALLNNTEVSLNALQSNTEVRLNALLNNTEVSINALQSNTEVSLKNPSELRLKHPILSNTLQNSTEVRLKNPLLSSALQNSTEVSLKNLHLESKNNVEISSKLQSPPLLEPSKIKTEVPPLTSNSPPLSTQTFSINSGIDDEFLIPSTSGLSNIQKKVGRRVPSYLKMYRLRDDKYPDVFSCKHCFGIYTTLDAGIFHPCLKKRRGRRPKLLQDCVVPS
ncbi:hypothetical protein O3M35_009105 [Rhynocoris fuscipes]|uniref:Uncharacterized protein n=1 Tax=Rhynocoris fuscipes TaxID=488301 RepID=A0AAW1D4F6_9HEMI